MLKTAFVYLFSDAHTTKIRLRFGFCHGCLLQRLILSVASIFWRVSSINYMLPPTYFLKADFASVISL